MPKNNPLKIHILTPHPPPPAAANPNNPPLPITPHQTIHLPYISQFQTIYLLSLMGGVVMIKLMANSAQLKLLPIGIKFSYNHKENTGRQ